MQWEGTDWGGLTSDFPHTPTFLHPVWLLLTLEHGLLPDADVVGFQLLVEPLCKSSWCQKVLCSYQYVTRWACQRADCSRLFQLYKGLKGNDSLSHRSHRKIKTKRQKVKQSMNEVFLFLQVDFGVCFCHYSSLWSSLVANSRSSVSSVGDVVQAHKHSCWCRT